MTTIKIIPWMVITHMRYIHIYIYVYMDTYMCICVNIHIYIYIYTHFHTYVQKYIYYKFLWRAWASRQKQPNELRRTFGHMCAMTSSCCILLIAATSSDTTLFHNFPEYFLNPVKFSTIRPKALHLTPILNLHALSRHPHDLNQTLRQCCMVIRICWKVRRCTDTVLWLLLWRCDSHSHSCRATRPHNHNYGGTVKLGLWLGQWLHWQVTIIISELIDMSITEGW